MTTPQAPSSVSSILFKLRTSALALCASALAVTAFGAAVQKPVTVLDTPNAGSIVEQSAAYDTSATYRAEKAVDGKWAKTSTDCWIAKLDSSHPAAYFVYRFNNPTVVDGIRIHNSDQWGEVSRAPNTWTFEGSDDGVNWTVLDTHADETGWVANKVRSFTFANTTAYQYYKYNCTKSNGATYVAIFEVEFLQDSPIDITTPTSGDVFDASTSSATYTSAGAFDDNKHTKAGLWIATNNPPMYVVYKFNNPSVVNAISVFNANNNVTGNAIDSASRSPKNWTFEGSNDGATWTVLDTQTDETDWSATGEERYYEFENTGSYSYYKFNCTEINGSEWGLQLYELEFYYRNIGGPILGVCTMSSTETAGTLAVSATLTRNGANTISCIVSDGTTTTTNVFATAVAEGETATGTITGLSADKTYAISFLAVNEFDSCLFDAGSFYTGVLSLGDTTDALESSLTPGTVEVSRASNDPLPLTVNYTITGNIGTEGATWETPVAIAIPANAKTGSLLVKPLVDITITADVTATVALADGYYGIPASPDDAKTLTIVNDDTPTGFETLVITNALDNPAGGFFSAAPASALNNNADRIVRFANPEEADPGLREFSQYMGDWVYVESGNSVVTRDWMLAASMNAPSAGKTVGTIDCATTAITGLRARQDIRTYMGSWYVPDDGVYSFRMHMGYVSLFSLDGKLILRQFNTNPVATNGVALTKGWHSFYVAFASSPSPSQIGPASGETLGFSFSANNEELTAAEPGSAFSAANGYRFSTAFNSVLIPSMWAKGGDIWIDCANLPGDLRIAGQIASLEHQIKIVNLPAGRSLELGRPLNNNTTGWQDLSSGAYLAWNHTTLPPGVGIRLEGSAVIDATWAASGRGSWSADGNGAFTLGNNVIIHTEVANLFGEYTDEFRYPAGLVFLEAAKPAVIGDTAKIYVPANCAFGYGGAPFTMTKLPITRTIASKSRYYNDFELGSGAVINATLPSNGVDDRLLGDITGPGAQGALKITGWSRAMKFFGNVDVQSGSIGQRGCRMYFQPQAGTTNQSFSGTLTLSGEKSTYNASGWNWPGATLFFSPEIPGELPMYINTVSASDAFFYPENYSTNKDGTIKVSTMRQGAILSTCSNNTVNVTKLTGAGVHLCAQAPFPAGQDGNEQALDAGMGPANFVFGQIVANSSAAMKLFVYTNVNITVTNLAKAAFRYDMTSNAVNAAVLDIEGTCSNACTITATDIAVLPARVKGFTGEITLTETEAKTYPVVFDFDEKGGIPIGGCDGSGTLAAAPSSGTIELSFAGTPPDRGEGRILRFDNANGLLSGWTVNAPSSYTVNGKKYGIKVVKDDNGFTFKLGKLGMFFAIR